MSFSLNSFRKLRRLISLLCLLAVLVPILSMCMPTQAYAASKYKVGVTVGLRLTDVYGGVNTYAYT